MLMCSRQCGKTEFAVRFLAMVANQTANVACLYLALVRSQARTVWRRKWIPLLRKLRLYEFCYINETDMLTIFPNGSIVAFGGTDDARHVATLLGDSMAGGLAIIDECQSQPQLMEELVTNVLEPMLSQTTIDKPKPGRIVLSGTIPTIPAGYFWDLWAKGLVENKIANDNGDSWGRYNWSRFENPFLTNPEVALQKTLKRWNKDVDDPQIQRDWFGRWVFDVNDTALRYDIRRNSYTAENSGWVSLVNLQPGELRAVAAQPGIDRFAIGLDPAATADRFAIVMWGWSSSERKGLHQIAEWVTDRGANALESQYIAVILELKERYGLITRFPCRVIRDAGSAKTTNDTLYRNHGILIEAANKGSGSLYGRVARFNDLLGTHQAYVIQGSELEADCRLARWDKKERAVGRYKWDRLHHPDVLDAATYAVEPYCELAGFPMIGPKMNTEQEAMAREEAEATAKMFQEALNKQPEQQTMVSSQLWNSRGNAF